MEEGGAASHVTIFNTAITSEREEENVSRSPPAAAHTATTARRIK